MAEMTPAGAPHFAEEYLPDHLQYLKRFLTSP
jgi:hypothetical protein